MAGGDEQPIETPDDPVIEEAREFWRRVGPYLPLRRRTHPRAERTQRTVWVIAAREEEASLHAIEQEWQRREFIRRYG